MNFNIHEKQNTVHLKLKKGQKVLMASEMRGGSDYTALIKAINGDNIDIEYDDYLGKKMVKEIHSSFVKMVLTESSLEETEMKFQALAMAKELHSQLANLTFIEMLSVMSPDNPAKKEVQDLETKINQLTTEVGEFIQKYIPDVADAETSDTDEMSDDETKTVDKKPAKKETNEASIIGVSFRDYLNETKDLEYRHIEQHMAKGDYNVVNIKQMKSFGNVTHYVEINNLPTNKQGLVDEKEFLKAQHHLDKLGLGKNYLVHTKQKINTTAGGRFTGKSSINN